MQIKASPRRDGRTSLLKRVYRDRHFLLMLLIPLAMMVIFKLLPIIGNVIAFRQYRVGGSLFGDRWVGLKYYQMFMKDPSFWTVFKNSLTLSLLNLAVNFPMPIIFALLLNELPSHRFRRITQTISYLPRFLATVVVVAMLREMLSPDNGIVNQIIGGFGVDPIYFMNDSDWYRPIYILSHSWQFAGFYAVIYLSALTSINPELYEAASIDGANRFKKMLHITIPGIQTTVLYMLLMSIGSMLNFGYDKSVLLYTPSNSATSDIIETFVFRMGVERNSYSYSAAVGLFSSVIGVTLLSISNYLSKKYADTSFY